MPPLTVIVTDSACVVVMLDEVGLTVTVGVVFTGAGVTVMDAVPDVTL